MPHRSGLIVTGLLVACASSGACTWQVGGERSVPAVPATTGVASLWTRTQGVDWPSFLGPEGDGKSPETGLQVPWPEAGPRVVWQRPVDAGYGSGAVSKGRYFHFDRSGNQARLTAMHAETGEELWQFEYPTDYRDMLGYSNGPRCSPVVDEDRVYIYGVEGMLHCVAVGDGELIWKVNTSERFGVVQNFFGVGSTPVVEGDMLICQVGGSPPGSPGLYEASGQVEGNGSGIVAFDKRTGEVIYSVTDELASYASPRLATIDGRRWCFVLARSGLVGLEPSTGAVDFHYPWRARLLESVNASTPVVAGNQVFISETYQVGSSLIEARPGGYDVVWADSPQRRDKAMRAHWSTPIYVDGFLYGCSGRNPPDANLRCIQWQTGAVEWAVQEAPEDRARSSLLYVDGHFIALGEFGSLKLIKVNPKRYQLVSQVTLTREPSGFNAFASEPLPLLKYPCWAAPILSHGLLFVRGEDRLVCLEVIPEP